MLRARGQLWCCAGWLVVAFGCASMPRAARSAAPLRDSAQSQAYNERGLMQLTQGHPDAAERSFRQAIALDPYNGPALSNVGISLLQQGKAYDEAAWSFRHAAQLMPGASQPHLNLALLYEHVGRLGTAEESLRRALQINPDDIEVIGHLARISIRQHRRSPEIQNWLAEVAERDNDPTWRDWARRQLIRNNRPTESTGETP